MRKEILLERLFPVEGKVLDVHGKGIPRVWVIGTRLDRPSPGSGKVTVYTDRNGNFYMALPRGKWSITVVGAGLSIPSRTVNIEGKPLKLIFREGN